MKGEEKNLKSKEKESFFSQTSENQKYQSASLFVSTENLMIWLIS